MAEQRNDLLQARTEAALLLRLDPTNLSPSDVLRCDLVASLRLVVDDASATVLDGRGPDLSRLIVATETLIKLLPSEPPKSAADQREDRDATVAPLLKLFRYLHETVHTLTAENAQLRARLGIAPALSDVPTQATGDNSPVEGSTAITPTEADLCPPGEWRGVPPMPGPDDPPRRSTAVIDGKAERHRSGGANATPAAPPAPEPWQDWLDAGGYGGPGYDRWADNR